MKSQTIHLTFIFVLFVSKLASQVNFNIASGVCLNDTELLVANTGSLSNVTFTWSSFPTGANFTSISSPTTNVTFTALTNYTISLKIKSGTFIDSVSHSVLIHPLPNIILSKSSLTTCVESNFPMFSQPVHLTAAGGVSYTWNPPPAPSLNGGNPNGPLNDVRPVTTECFSVTGKDINGCKSTTNTCISVIPRFSITTAPSSTSICWSIDPSVPDGPALLTMGNPSSPSFGLPSTHTYTWTSSTGGIGLLTTEFSPSIYVYHSSTITFTAQVKDSLGCISLPATATVISQKCTDVLEIVNESDLVLFPNPVKDILHLDLLGVISDVSITITDLAGRIVLKLDQLPPENEILISQFSTGIYFVNLVGKGLRKTIKIVKE